jgi:hypothetical protein
MPSFRSYGRGYHELGLVEPRGLMLTERFSVGKGRAPREAIPFRTIFHDTRGCSILRRQRKGIR